MKRRVIFLLSLILILIQGSVYASDEYSVDMSDSFSMSESIEINSSEHESLKRDVKRAKDANVEVDPFFNIEEESDLKFNESTQLELKENENSNSNQERRINENFKESVEQLESSGESTEESKELGKDVESSEEIEDKEQFEENSEDLKKSEEGSEKGEESEATEQNPVNEEESEATEQNPVDEEESEETEQNPEEEQEQIYLFTILKDLIENQKQSSIELEPGEYKFKDTIKISKENFDTKNKNRNSILNNEEYEVELKNDKEKPVIFKRDENFKGPFFEIFNDAKLILNGSYNDKIIFQGNNISSGIEDKKGTMIENRGKLVINGATFKEEKVYPDSKTKMIAPIHSNGRESSIDFRDGKITDNVFGKNIMFSAGGILLTDEAKMTMSGGEISNNKVAVYENIIVKVLVDKSEYKNIYMSTDYYNGGAITILDSSEFTMKDGKIHNNNADIGAVFVGDSDIEYNNQLVEETEVDENGEKKVILKIRDKINSKFLLEGGEIKHNLGELSAALGILGHGETEIKGGELSHNIGYYSGPVFISDMYSGMIRLTSSGWQFFDSGWEHYTKYKGLNPKIWKSVYKTAFKLNGGQITNNKSVQGGTIHVLSNYVELNKGLIENNYSYVIGGALFNQDPDNTVRIKNVYFEGNHAFYENFENAYGAKTFGSGGAIWFCPTGDGQFYAENGMSLFDNTAEKAGDDFTKEYSERNVMVVLPDRLPNGVKIGWFKDNLDKRYDSENPIAYTELVNDSKQRKFLKTVIPEEYKEVSKSLADLFIINNKASIGGGIASNGTIIIGEIPDEEHPLKNFEIKKNWGPGTTPEKIDVEVRIKLNKDGKEIDYLLESVELNEDNNYKYSIEDLPGRIAGYELEDIIYIKEITKGDYEVVISPISVDTKAKKGSVVKTPKGDHNIYYKELLETITNKLPDEPPKKYGDIIISKEVEGEENSEEEFNFKIILKDKDKKELKELFNYILSKSEEIIKKGKIKSGDTFQLIDGEEIKIKDIPYNTRYEVSEEDTGEYIISSEGEIGSVKSKENYVKFINTKPDEPDEPDEPPEEPDEPDEPDEPPEEPDEPDNPPETPDKPDKPKTPPEEPEIPEEPEEPEEPPTPPEEPEIPEEPEESEEPPVEPEEPESPPEEPYNPKEAPKTFDQGIRIYILIGLCSLLGLVLLKREYS